MLLTAHAQIYCISRKERKKEKRIFWERCAAQLLMPKRYENTGLQNLWVVNSPITSFRFFFFLSYQSLWVLRRSRKQMDYYSRRKMIWSYGVRPIIRGKIPQARPRWTAWSLAYASVNIWHKNNSIKALGPSKTRQFPDYYVKRLHASYIARARAAWRAIYT